MRAFTRWIGMIVFVAVIVNGRGDAHAQAIPTETPTPDAGSTPTPIPSLITPTVTADAGSTPTPIPTGMTETPTITASPTSDGMVTLPATRSPTQTPTRDGDIAIYQEVEALFPQAIRFVIAVTPPIIEIESARLTVTFDGRPPQTREVDLESESFVGDPYTALSVIWLFTPETVPPLFSLVSYAWEVRASDGRYSDAAGTYRFQDERLTWMRFGDDRMRMAVGAGEAVSSGVFGVVRQAFDALGRAGAVTRPYSWLIYDGVMPGCARDSLGEPIAVNAGDIAIPCDPTLAARLYAEYDLLQRPPDVALDDAIIEAMVQDSFAAAWAESRPPVWFQEGIAQYFHVAKKGDPLATAREAISNNGLYTLDAMESAPPDDPARRRVWRAQSYGMIVYLVERIGRDGVYALAGTRAPFAGTLEAALGESAEGLALVWSRWIETRAADDAYGVSPYIALTPTPSQTWTPSWTPTPTPTLTPSITLSPTVTGYLSPTPRPTNTPSDTPDAPTATPSVTPRPPGSLPTVTPIPPPTVASALADPTIQSGVLIVLIVILLILVIAVLRVGNKS
jgi:hypothetical protein